MTVPSPPAPPPLAPPAPPSPVQFPLGWLLRNAAAPIQYRAIVDVAKATSPITDQVAALPYAYRPAITLAVVQSPDGTWNRSMLSVPSARAQHFEGVGTITAVRRLLEYGWDRDSPPLYLARRILFRLLAEDDDPAFLYDLAAKDAVDEDSIRWGRGVIRQAAAATLAQAGYERDPRLRGAAHRLLERTAEYLRSPLAQKPWVRVGNKQVLSQDAVPPTFYTLQMLAHMPLFRIEHAEHLERIYQYISQPQPRQEAVQLCGQRLVPQPHFILGDMLPHRNAADEDVPWALTWLELMARLGFLRRNEGWCKLFDRFLDERDREGVWHPHKGLAAPRSSNPFTWPSFPLEESATGDLRWTDVTFRLGLIARLSGRPIELV